MLALTVSSGQQDGIQLKVVMGTHCIKVSGGQEVLYVKKLLTVTPSSPSPQLMPSTITVSVSFLPGSLPLHLQKKKLVKLLLIRTPGHFWEICVHHGIENFSLVM